MTYNRKELAALAGLQPSNITRGRAGRALAALKPRYTPRGYAYSEEQAAQFLAALNKGEGNGRSNH